MIKNYFSYGSNMSLKRLRKRVPSAEVVGTYTLLNHKLCFHKRSCDKSGNKSAKCDAYKTDNENDKVIGRLFTIDTAHECTLDKAEGLGKGYKRECVCLVDENGETEAAFAYFAVRSCIDNNLKPYT